jgi:membrane associated rhomboid family serine protease
MIFPIGDDNIKGGHFPLFSYVFIAVNILVFYYQFTLSDQDMIVFLDTWGAIPADLMSGSNWSSILTSMFLHGGILHLVGNMLFLWIFADNIEATIGSGRFVFFYLTGGIVAFLVHFYFNMESTMPTVGASGAISAVMGAYLVMFPTSRVKMFVFFFTFRISAFIFLVVWFIQQWLENQNDLSNIAYWAHIGGFAVGVISGIYFKNKFPNAERKLENHLVRNGDEFV